MQSCLHEPLLPPYHPAPMHHCQWHPTSTCPFHASHTLHPGTSTPPRGPATFTPRAPHPPPGD
ncbi:hypothetical protein E2C01_091606 [Portunus trituberculatus]|uniref:Uncharacterized protein n=1 Tax=Portunus trituberculatus TaxID=210409 RepID=A0A5B7JND4_PORTR|nr:hypothetical protein [Portunus trituberculatus]